MKPDRSEVLAALERVLASSHFAAAGRQSRFLKYVVEKTLAGEALKESLIAVEVYGRPSDYDSKADSIVRVEASRLRLRLESYYQGSGKDDVVRISLPKGGYSCEFEKRGEVAAEAGEAAAQKPRNRNQLWLAVAGGVVVMLALAAVLVPRRGEADGTITIRPFRSESGDRTVSEFARELTETTAARLARSRQVRVSSSASGKVLLEGNVRRHGGQFHVAAKLVQGADGVYLWAETFEHPDGDPEKAQREIADLISASLAGQGQRSLTVGTAPLPEFLEAHLLMRSELAKSPEEARAQLERAIQLLRKAEREQPNSALVYSGLAKAHLGLADYVDGKFVELHQTARGFAERALRLDDSLDDAHDSLGVAAFFGHWDLKLSLSEFTRALQINPRRAHTHSLRSDVLCILGRYGEAVAELDAAQALEPTNVEVAAQRAAIFYRWGKSDEAGAAVKRALAIEPGNSYALWVMGLINEQQGRMKEAEAQFRKLPFRPVRSPLALAHLLASSGRKKEAFEIAAAVDRVVHTAAGQAIVQAGAGNKAAAMAGLERAYQERDLDLLYTVFDPRLASLRAEPAFRGLMAKLGIEVPQGN